MKLTIKTSGNTDIIDITDDIIKILNKYKHQEGLINIFVKGSTAAITTIEADNNLYQDFKDVLDEIIPIVKNWRHHRTWGDDNGGSHLRASLFGPSLSVPMVDGKIQIGTWQRIVLIDFDTSPRQREVIITVVKIVDS